jgi:heme/copper-type cytochrome/quinol oxidase subunit 3|tara:strand:- start:3080 stop:3217 length:138 start_codon:yes stop_codon:yes gene_type:complete
MGIELMGKLNNYSERAEIFSATTIIFGAFFALVQFREYRKRQEAG